MPFDVDFMFLLHFTLLSLSSYNYNKLALKQKTSSNTQEQKNEIKFCS